MAYRTGAVIALQSSTVPQPLFGSWVTAASRSLATPQSQPFTITLGTACSSGNDASQLFNAGELAALINPDGTQAESVYIASISGNILSLGVQPGTNTVTRLSHVAGVFGTGSFIAPNNYANNFLVQREDNGTGQWQYIGNQWNMTATFRRIFKIANVATNTNPFYYTATENFFGNPFSISELWTLGTSGDLYNTAFNIV